MKLRNSIATGLGLLTVLGCTPEEQPQRSKCRDVLVGQGYYGYGVADTNGDRQADVVYDQGTRHVFFVDPEQTESARKYFDVREIGSRFGPIAMTPELRDAATRASQGQCELYYLANLATFERNNRSSE